MVRKVVLGGGVPLVGPQEELRGPSGYTPRGFSRQCENIDTSHHSGLVGVFVLWR